MTRVWFLSLALVGCTDWLTPLSLDLHYSADAPRLSQAEQLKHLKIGVARFFDGRKLLPDDVHSASYVAQDKNYHIGLTWGGHTFAPVAEVVQGLLISELEHAGLTVVPLDARVDADDVSAAQAAGQGCDIVLGGVIHVLAYNQSSFDDPNPTAEIEATAFELPEGRALFHGRYVRNGSVGYNEPPRQQKVDRLFDRALRPAAHQLIKELASTLAENKP
jgi:hypothetical protein